MSDRYTLTDKEGRVVGDTDGVGFTVKTGSGSQLWTALAQAQGEFPPIPKTRSAMQGRYFYADLGDVLSVVTPVLARHGICVRQPIWTDEKGQTWLDTELRLGSELATSSILVPTTKGNQDFGATLSYLRRYCLCASLGIFPEDDVDGDMDQQTEPREKQAPKGAAEPGTPTPPPAQAKPTGLPSGVALMGPHLGTRLVNLSLSHLEESLRFLEDKMRKEGKTLDTLAPPSRAYYFELQAEMQTRMK